MAAGSPISMRNAAARISTTQAGPVLKQATIADLAALTGGESPTEAEHNLVVSKVNAILAALEASGLFASS
jgi:hypothetical protein